jgi:acyl-CoA thioesterase
VAEPERAVPRTSAAGTEDHRGEAPATSDAPGTFDRDTAVRRVDESGSSGSGGSGGGGEQANRFEFAADVSPDWRAGRGPHGGYLAAIILRALAETVAEPARAPRSLTIHYARAPDPGPVSVHTTIERAGRSLSTLSARMERDGRLIALALAAFSVPWSAQEIADLEMPEVAPPDAEREAGTLRHLGAPPFTSHIVLQRRIGPPPFTPSDLPMEVGGWLGLSEPRPIDALSLAFFSDALFSPPYTRLTERATTPTVDLTVHFRTSLPPWPSPDGWAADRSAADGSAADGLRIERSELARHELCLARFSTRLVHEGFFEEDGVIWAADGSVLAQSRQLGIVMPLPSG